MVNWRLVIGFGGFAFFISLISGFAGGVNILVVLLRTLVSTILFAGLGAALGILLEKFLPDLAEALQGQPINKAQQLEEGSEIDITLPDENPHHRQSEKDDFLDDEDFSDEDQPEQYNQDDDIGDEDSGDEPPEKHKKGKSGKKKKSGYKKKRKVNEQKRQESRPSYNDDEEDMNLNNEDVGDSNSLIGADDLDKLPDLDSFSGTFADFKGADSEPNLENVAPSRPESNSGTGSKEDPAKMARAIQTWMTRDKEG